MIGEYDYRKTVGLIKIILLFFNNKRKKALANLINKKQ